MIITDKDFNFKTPISIADFARIMKGAVPKVKKSRITELYLFLNQEENPTIYIGGEGLSIGISNGMVTGISTCSGGNFYEESDCNRFEYAMDDVHTVLKAKGIEYIVV